MSELLESRKRRHSAKAIDNPELPKRKKTPTPNSSHPQASHRASKVPKPTVEDSCNDDDQVAHQQSHGGSLPRPEYIIEAVDVNEDGQDDTEVEEEEEEDGELKETSKGAQVCVGAWSLLGFVKDSNVEKVSKLDEIDDDEDELLEVDGWDHVIIKNSVA